MKAVKGRTTVMIPAVRATEREFTRLRQPAKPAGPFVGCNDGSDCTLLRMLDRMRRKTHTERTRNS